MATHSSILAWEIPWTEEPGGLQSMGSQGVRHNLVTKQQEPLYMKSTVFSYTALSYFLYKFSVRSLSLFSL